MAARGEAQADVEVSTLVVPAWRLRWRAPELALVLGERAVALASTRRDEVDRLRAEALVVFASNRMGRGVRIADRALDALKAAEAASERETAWRLRVELADSARAVGAPLTGFAAVRPVLEADDVPPGLRAAALVQASECLVSVGRGAALAQALDEADQLYQADPLLDHDTTLLHRGLLRASAAGQHRRWGDLQAAVAAARDGLAVLDRLKEAESDNGQVRGRLTVELVCALMDLNKPGEASELGTPLLERPVRAPSASTAGWLRLALATRVHLPAGRVDQARDLLRDAADSAERHQLDTLLAESLLALAHVHEVAGDLAEALANLRSAHAAERRRARAVYAVRARLAAEFAGVHRRPAGGLHDELAALLRTGTPATVPPTDPDLAPDVKQQLRQWRPVQMHRNEGVRVKRSRRAAEDMTVDGISAARAHAADRWRLVQPFGETEGDPQPGGRRRAPEPEARPTHGRPEHARTVEARPANPHQAADTAPVVPGTPVPAPSVPAPAVSAPSATAPSATAPSATAPSATAPEDSARQDSAPQSPVPQVSAPQSPAPSGAQSLGPHASAHQSPGPQASAPESPTQAANPTTALAKPRSTAYPGSDVTAGGGLGGAFDGAPVDSHVASAGADEPMSSGTELSVPSAADHTGAGQGEVAAGGEAATEVSSPAAAHEGGERSVPAAGLIAAAGAVRSGRRRAAREAADGERSSGESGADSSVLDTLKAAGLLDPQRAGGRRRAPDADDEPGGPQPVQVRTEPAPLRQPESESESVRQARPEPESVRQALPEPESARQDQSRTQFPQQAQSVWPVGVESQPAGPEPVRQAGPERESEPEAQPGPEPAEPVRQVQLTAESVQPDRPELERTRSNQPESRSVQLMQPEPQSVRSDQAESWPVQLVQPEPQSARPDQPEPWPVQPEPQSEQAESQPVQQVRFTSEAVRQSQPEPEPVQWRVEPPSRLRSEEPPAPVDMFDSPTMVQPAVRDDVPPVGLGAAFVKGPLIPTARVPDPPDYPVPPVSDFGLPVAESSGAVARTVPPQATSVEGAQTTDVEERPVFPATDVDSAAAVDLSTPQPEPDQVPGVPEPDQVPPVPVPDPVPADPSPEATPPFSPTGFLSAADVEHDDTPPVEQAAEPATATETPKEPFVTAVVVGGKTIDLPAIVEPTPPAPDSPSATRASRRHKSDLSLAELLAEALVAYEDARREDEAAGRGEVDEDTVPISPVGNPPPASENETTAPIQRVDPPRRFDTWTLPES
ncbi:hypothetical protein B0I31_103511 [Saccharothrix carnea]|uniref:Tetratricopeptide repeat protein n=1 Tax=Saccharothrix carnea TaxID=1280637 RepID=A0A2P8IE59_SACCR|nr:hypothetical protein [Saccharothrix carnea]PSL56755.1 hypothetical protein B0I31_103511 [Saccharothrix carnea]